MNSLGRLFGRIFGGRPTHPARLAVLIDGDGISTKDTRRVAARNFIFELCATSGRLWADSIDMWCYSHPVLTPDDFSSVVKEDILEAAKETMVHLGRVLPPLPEPLPNGALWPSCHGMPDALAKTEQTCIQCRFTDSCGKLTVMAKNTVRQSTGREQPRKGQLRAPATARQAAYRARLKLAAEKERAGFRAGVGTPAPMPDVLTP